MLRETTRADPGFDAFVAALAAAALATEDLDEAPCRYFTLDDAAWGGIGAGEDALLRSIVVLPHARGQGLGERIVEGLVQAARTQGARRLWLLTISAAPFFARLGWQTSPRANAPAAITRSRQFTNLCPASAILMVRSIDLLN